MDVLSDCVALDDQDCHVVGQRGTGGMRSDVAHDGIGHRLGAPAQLRGDNSRDEAPMPGVADAERLQLRDVLPPLSNVADRVASLLRRTEKDAAVGGARRVEPVMQSESRR